MVGKVATDSTITYIDATYDKIRTCKFLVKDRVPIEEYDNIYGHNN